MDFPNLNELSNIEQIVYTWLLTHGLRTVFIIVAMIVGRKIANTAIKRILHIHTKTSVCEEFNKKLQTIYAIIHSLADFVIIAVGTMLVLNELGINIGPILAAAGVLGVAVGFGAKRLVEDVITGFIILLSDQIRVGDIVQIGDKGGTVEKLDLKMVVLRDLHGNVHFIRNGMIDIVTNMTKEFSYAVFEIGVAYKENIDHVIEVMKEIDAELRLDEKLKFDILEPMDVFGLDKFDDSAIVIKARIKTKPVKQWAVARAYNLILKRKFDELGIEIPFPQRTLHVEKDALLK